MPVLMGRKDGHRVSAATQILYWLILMRRNLSLTIKKASLKEAQVENR